MAKSAKKSVKKAAHAPATNPIAKPKHTSAPLDGKIQPMVKYCPTCKGDLQLTHSTQSASGKTENPHNFWCCVCNRHFSINYQGRDNLEQAWIDANNPKAKPAPKKKPAKKTTKKAAPVAAAPAAATPAA